MKRLWKKMEGRQPFHHLNYPEGIEYRSQITLQFRGKKSSLFVIRISEARKCMLKWAYLNRVGLNKGNTGRRYVQKGERSRSLQYRLVRRRIYIMLFGFRELGNYHAVARNQAVKNGPKGK